MAERLVGNQNGSTSYPSTKSPSTHDRDAVEGGFTSSFPADRVTHSHMSVKGETGYAGQYRAKGNVAMNRGPSLDRAVPRQGPYGDNAETFGKIGSGVPGPDRKGKWSSTTGKSNSSVRPTSESFSDSDDDSYSRRYGSGGLGKSG